jgi:hypothetical protein
MELKVGDKVLYSKYGGSEFKPGNVEYLIVSWREQRSRRGVGLNYAPRETTIRTRPRMGLGPSIVR